MLPKIFLKDIRLMALSQIARDELESLRDAIYQLQIHDIDNVHASFLPFLAWIYRADEWDNAWPEEQKRDVVKNALLLFQYKGTIWAVKRALQLSGFESELTVWHQMVPVGERGTFQVYVYPGGIYTPHSFFREDYERIYRLVEANKQGSQTWSGAIFNQVNGSMYAASVLTGRRRYVIKG